MNCQLKRKLLAITSAACLLFTAAAGGMTVLAQNEQNSAVQVGDVFQPDDSKWGTQNNNGWYFMKESGGNYMEVNYYTADEVQDVDGHGPVPWMANRFASNPFVDGEMYFIDKTNAFVGEGGTKPVYAFEAPAAGKVELSVTALAQEGVFLDFYAGDTKLGDSAALNNTGEIEGGYTLYTRTADVKKGDRIYVAGYTTNANRDIFLDYTKLSVKYLEVSTDKPEEEDPYIGKSFAPDFTAPKWGTQNNNGWYFMYQDRLTGEYKEITEFVKPDATTRPDGTPYEVWEKGTHGRFSMCAQYPFLFIGTEVIHPASSANPVKAFKAPIGGEVEFTFSVKRSHPYPAADGNGNPSHMTVYRNNEKIFPTEGEYINITDGEYQKYTFKCNVKKDTWIYFVLDCGGNNANGEAWMTQSAKYLSTNDQVEDNGTSDGEDDGSIIGKPFTIDTSAENWGKKNNNNWEFMFWDVPSGKFKSMAFVRSEGIFKGPSEGGYDYLMIKTLEMHPSQQGYPAKVFVAPESGEIELTVIATLQAPAASETGTGIRIYRGNTQIWPADGSCDKLGTEEETIKQTIKVRKNERIAVVVDPIDGNIISDATNVSVSAKYLSLSNEPPVDDPYADGGDSLPETGRNELLAVPMLLCGSALGILLLKRRRRND